MNVNHKLALISASADDYCIIFELAEDGTKIKEVLRFKSDFSAQYACQVNTYFLFS
jgi:hypothetical protein